MERVETFANTDPEKMPQRHLGKEEPGPAFLLNGPSVFLSFCLLFPSLSRRSCVRYCTEEREHTKAAVGSS